MPFRGLLRRRAARQPWSMQPTTLVRAATAPDLPQAGPQWFGSVMGTGILATLLHLHREQLPGAEAASRVLLVVAAALLLGLSAAFGRRCRTVPGAFGATVRDVGVAVTWGLVAMGVLGVGSATAVVLPAWVPGLTGFAWGVDLVLWVVGTTLGLVTAVGFLSVLVRHDIGAPTLTWGLAVVPPVVSATSGAALALRTDGAWRAGLLVAAALCFTIGLLLAGVIFAVGYHHHWRVAPLLPAAATTAWIPLGVVGQSTAAAQGLVTAAGGGLGPWTGETLRAVANAYGLALVAFGAVLVGWAALHTVRGFRAGMAFSPSWWGLVFPFGTLSLGAYTLAGGTGLEVLRALAVVVCVALVGTWTLCALATGHALLRGGRGIARGAAVEAC